MAVSYLQKRGYVVLATNFRTKWGEIDIIAKKDTTIFFFEVKTRVGESKGRPYEAVTARKITHLQKASTVFVLQNNLQKAKLALYVISILLFDNLNTKSIQEFKIL